MPIVSSEVDSHRTFMDTHGRTSLKLTALNVVDDHRDRDIIVSEEDTPAALVILTEFSDHLRLPLDSRLQEANRNLYIGAGRVRLRFLYQQT